METEQAPRSASLDRSDEIDFVELCSDFWRKRLIISICVISGLVCGLLYVLLTPKAYEAEVALSAPHESDLLPITSVGCWSSDGQQLDFVVVQKIAFDLVNQYLLSRSLKRELMENPEVVKAARLSFPIADLAAKSRVLFNRMSLTLPNAKLQKDNAVASVKWPDPKSAGLILPLEKAELS